MWNSTKIKREKQRQADEQRRLDDMAAAVDMPPNWEPIGRDKKGWVYRWRNGDSFVEHRGGSWFWYTGINPNQYDLLQYFGSVAHVAVAEAKMEGLGWTWVRQDNYRANHEGPAFAWAGGNSKTRYNIRPWKKSDGSYVWRCHHPAFKTGDDLMEFLDPVSCAVAQEVAG